MPRGNVLAFALAILVGLSLPLLVVGVPQFVPQQDPYDEFNPVYVAIGLSFIGSCIGGFFVGRGVWRHMRRPT